MKRFAILTSVMMMFVLAPTLVSGERINSTGNSEADEYDLNARNIGAAYENSPGGGIQIMSSVQTTDYICGRNGGGSVGDGCSISTISKRLYKHNLNSGSRFDLRLITVENYGTPNEVDLVVEVCYRIPISDFYPNQMDCRLIDSNMGPGTKTFQEPSHRGGELYVYIRGLEGPGGDQTKIGIKAETLVSSNNDKIEPESLNQNFKKTDSVCREDCTTPTDEDHADGYEMVFFKGDSIEVHFWSSECEPDTGHVNHQTAVDVYLWRPSIPSSIPSQSNPLIKTWTLNEQNCVKGDGYHSFSINDAEEPGLVIFYFHARNTPDHDPAGYTIEVVEFDTTSRDSSYDSDGDGSSDIEEVDCSTNPYLDDEFPQDYDGDGTCDFVDEDDDNDGLPDIVDKCRVSIVGQTGGIQPDHDQDGCHDEEETDDDNDGVEDTNDNCPRGIHNLSASPMNDLDGDGCLDQEDNDIDGDGWSNFKENDCETDPEDGADLPPDHDEDDICDLLDSDDDNDGVPDVEDAFPLDDAETQDFDGDGIGNNADPDDDGDGVEDEEDAFPYESTQWSDYDGDGFGDNSQGYMPDAFPTDPTQWSDADGDGYGDNANGNNPDAWPADSTQWADDDGDGYGDNPTGTNGDAFPTDPTQWSDIDGDGYGDNPNGQHPDAYPNDSTQWIDGDGDGYGDNPSGANPDSCPAISGTSTKDRYGCPDDDGDGYSNQNDACPNAYGLSTIDRRGCSDSDGDGVSNPDGTWKAHPFGEADAFPFEGSQTRDSDGDGFGDNIAGMNGDECPGTAGNSTEDKTGCPDFDGDGFTEAADRFPINPDQWNDSDGDGFGDNSAGAEGDVCPSTFGNSTLGAIRGCPDKDGDGVMDGQDLCDAGINEVQKRENNCWRAVWADKELAYQGATIMLYLPILYSGWRFHRMFFRKTDS